MVDFAPLMMIAVIITALLLYALAWWAVRGAAPVLRMTARGLGAAVLAAGALWFLSAEMHLSRQMAPRSAPAPEAADGTIGKGEQLAPETEASSATKDSPTIVIADPPAAANGKPPAAANGKPPAAANGHSSPAVTPRASGSASPPSAASRPMVEPPESRAPAPAASPLPESPPDRSAASSEESAASPSPAETEWNIVPVFYGTDRERKRESEKVAYDWQRGRRLELGRALVTVPKNHVVPMVERPWAIRIPYIDVTLYEAAEDPRKHFTISELKALTKEEFLNLVKARLDASARFEDHALVFVHGYKTTFENALYRTAQIAYDLKFDGAPFLYSWPSGGTLQGYPYDRESAAQAEPYLREFLEIVVNETQAKKVSIIAHSMGNQVVLRVLQDLKRSLPEGVVISQLILAAPDVDRHAFENIVQSIRGIAEGITLYSAANDQALLISRRVNGGVPRAGDVPDDGPIIMEGVDTIDATASSMDSIGINHSGYAENNALLEDIGMLILSGLRPPEKRVPTLERVITGRGTYWRYRTIGSGIAGGGQ